jgi:hypothetical protein
MAIQKSIFAGMDDYTGAEISDIIQEVDNFIANTESAVEELSTLKVEVNSKIEKFDSPDALIEHIDIFSSKFQRYLIELRRVRGEICKSIENRHVETINYLSNICQSDEKTCRDFKNENICKSLKDESVRRIIDRIYEVTMGVAIDYWNLSNLRACLERFVGTVFNQSESAADTANQIIDLKPNLFGIGLNLNNAIKFVPKMWNKWFKNK